MPDETKKKTGRPEVNLNAEEVLKLAKMQCTYEEIGAWFGVSKRTIIRHVQRHPEIAQAIEFGKAHGRISIRTNQFRLMKLPNSAGVSMTIHLSKVHLGETEAALATKDGALTIVVKGGLPPRKKVS